MNEVETLRQRVAELERLYHESAETENRLSLINQVFEQSITANSLADIDGIITHVNDIFVRIWGYDDKKETIGKPINHFLKYEDETMKIITALDETGKWEGEYVGLRKDNTTFDAYGLATTILDDSGIIVGYQSTVLDITERKRIEHDLGKRDKELSCLYKITGIAEKQDITLDQLYQGVVNLLPPSWQYPEITCARIIVNGEIVETENCRDTEWKQSSDIYIKGNKIGIVEVSYLEDRPDIFDGPFLKEERDLINAVAIQLANITERKKIEESLKMSEQLYRAIFETTGTSMLIAEEDTTISLVNDGFEKLLGYSKEETEGKKSWKDIIAPDELEKVAGYHRLRRSNSNLPPKSYESKAIDKWGKVKNIITSVSVIPGTKRGVASYVDITERKNTEEELAKHRDHLNVLVKERTTDLEETNRKLAQEITERKKMGEKLQESRRYYTSAEIVGSFGHYSRYLDTNRLIWSEGTYRIFGVDPDKWELTRDNAAKLIHPEDYNMWDAANEEAERGNKDYNTEFRIFRPDGEERTLHSIANVIFDDTGKPERIFGTVVDITERKKAEEELRESEERYRSLVEMGAHIGEAIIMTQDTDKGPATHVFVNDEWSRITGYSKEELIGSAYLNLIHPNQRQEILDRHKRRVKGENIPGLFEIIIIRKDGTEILVEVTGSHTTYKGKTAVVSYYRDITERKKAGKALQESEEKLRLMFESVTDGITVTDLNGKIVDSNQSTARIQNYDSKEQLIGKNAFEFITERDHDRARENLEKTLEQGTSGIVEYTLLRKDGSEFQGELSASVLQDATGNPFGYIAITRDITERKKTEEALKESEEKFRTIADQNIMGIGILQDNVIKYVNKAMADIYGYTVEEILNWKPLEFFKLFSPDTLIIAKEQAVKKQTGDPSQLVYYIMHGINKMGKPICIDNFSRTISYQGRPADLVTQVDITERKTTERALQKARDDERNRIARELHDAVSQTLSSASIIAEVIPKLWERDQIEGKKRLEDVVSLTRSAQNELRSLLYELNPMTLANKEFEELLRLLASTAEKRTSIPIKLKIKGQCDFTPEINIALYRITQEALTNAGKYSKAKQININLTCQPKKVILKISDDGLGFDTNNTVPKGFGLNNMIERAEEIGASVSINSTIGHGTEIILTFRRT